MSFTIAVDGKEITLNPQPEPIEPTKLPIIETYYKAVPIRTSDLTLRWKPGIESIRKLEEIVSKMELLEEFRIDPTSETARKFIFGELKS